MELNDLGFYKKPRVLSGVKFLSHITETRKCGNRMSVYFPHKGTIDVIDWRYEPLMECDSNPVTFLTQWSKNDVYVQCIDDWEFIQYRPNTQWTAIKLEKEEEYDMGPLFAERYKAKDYFKLLLNAIYGKNYFCVMVEGGKGHPFEATGVQIEDGNAIVIVAPNDEHIERVVYTDIDSLEFEFTPGLDGKPGYYRAIRKEPLMKPEKTLDAIDFQDFYIKETFDRLKEVVVLYQEKFHTVLGMQQNLAKPGNYQLYLMRRLGGTVQKVNISSKQQFEYYKNADAWAIEPTEVLYTKVDDIKEQLRSDDAAWIYVSGVKKKLKRVSEISIGLLHFTFVNGEQIEHFYSTRGVRLRVREGKIATEYLLDHVKRMHV
jgi:hypothetical protein|nr:MAG TPA: hypothetical protein [Caudoviricetes sp.]